MKGIAILLFGTIYVSLVSCNSIQERTSAIRPCVTIAEGLLEMVEIKKDIGGQNGVDLYRMIEVFTGIDIQNQHSFTVIVCEIVQLGNDTAAITSYLRRTGVEGNLVRRMYDWYVATWTASIPSMEEILANIPEYEDKFIAWNKLFAEKFLEIYNILESKGFLDLDPVGVQDMHDWFRDQIHEDKRRKRSAPSSDCPRLISLIKAIFERRYYILSQQLDVSEDYLYGLVCTITDADSIDNIVSILDTNNVPKTVIDGAFRQFYFYLDDLIWEMERIVNTPVDPQAAWMLERHAFATSVLKVLNAMTEAGYF